MIMDRKWSQKIGRIHNVEIVGSSCFSKCKSLSSIIIESNSRLIHIESSAFEESSLQSILIPNSVEIVGSSCFSKCKSLSSITFKLNSHLARIESEAFYESSLESIMIPSNVEILGSSCFFLYCQSLSSIIFESNSHLTCIESVVYVVCLVDESEGDGAYRRSIGRPSIY
jgi:hypothetical protein